MTSRSIAEHLGDFIASVEIEALPADVLDKARCVVLYGFGMAISGNETLREIPRAMGREALSAGAGPATLLLHGGKVSAGEAIIINTAAFHARPQSDTMGTAHFGVMLLPMLLAMSEQTPEWSREFVPALIAGYEVGGALEKNFASLSSAKGFRASTVYGVIAAAAAAARMKKLTRERAAAAVAIAASFAGGILQTFEDDGSEWQFQAGIAAQNGLLAAELAARGAEYARYAFEGKYGLLSSFAGVEPGRRLSGDSLGEEWSIHRVMFKTYPVCTLCQTPIIAALELKEKIGGRAVESIHVRMNPSEARYPGIAKNTGIDTYSGISMSVAYCVAKILIDGQMSLSSLINHRSDEVDDLCKRIHIVPDDEVPVMSCRLRCVTEDGGHYHTDKDMTDQDYNFDMTAISELVRRCGREENVDEKSYDYLEKFVADIPNGNVDDIISAFRGCAST